MPVLNFGEKLSSVYLERFNPPDGQPVKVSLLALQTIATECHWLDFPAHGVRGMYQCVHGVCCQAFGNRNQNYHVPVFVYSSVSPIDGTLMDWSMPQTVYRNVCDLASRYNLLDYDLEVRKERKGNTNYSTTTVTIVPDVKLRSQMSDDLKAKLKADVEAYFSVGESSMLTPMTEQEYARILAEMGYDFQNRRFPTSGYSAQPQMSSSRYAGASQPIGLGPQQTAGIGIPMMSPAGSVSQMRPANASVANVGSISAQAGYAQPAASPVPANAVGEAREISMDEIDSLLN